MKFTRFQFLYYHCKDRTVLCILERYLRLTHVHVDHLLMWMYGCAVLVSRCMCIVFRSDHVCTQDVLVSTYTPHECIDQRKHACGEDPLACWLRNQHELRSDRLASMWTTSRDNVLLLLLWMNRMMMILLFYSQFVGHVLHKASEWKEWSTTGVLPLPFQFWSLGNWIALITELRAHFFDPNLCTTKSNSISTYVSFVFFFLSFESGQVDVCGLIQTAASAVKRLC